MIVSLDSIVELSNYIRSMGFVDSARLRVGLC
jgi:hypothetical protein